MHKYSIYSTCCQKRLPQKSSSPYPLTQQELAIKVSATRESTNKALAALTPGPHQVTKEADRCGKSTGIAGICSLAHEISAHTLAQLTGLSTGKANCSMAFKR
jgi:hypothetical protein